MNIQVGMKEAEYEYMHTPEGKWVFYSPVSKEVEDED